MSSGLRVCVVKPGLRGRCTCHFAVAETIPWLRGVSARSCVGGGKWIPSRCPCFEPFFGAWIPKSEMGLKDAGSGFEHCTWSLDLPVKHATHYNILVLRSRVIYNVIVGIPIHTSFVKFLAVVLVECGDEHIASCHNLVSVLNCKVLYLTP
jgi:hypothetical protein